MTESRVILPRIIDYDCGCGARLVQLYDGGKANHWSMFCCSQHTPADLGRAMQETMQERELTFCNVPRIISA